MKPAALFVLISLVSSAESHGTMEVAVGAQYDSTHVYVSPKDIDAFVTSFAAAFGGQRVEEDRHQCSSRSE